MEYTEAIQQYNYALKLGQKYYKACLVQGKYPYPQVLDDIFNETMCAGHQDMGIVNIPIAQIVGTKSAGRKAAFAGNFMPLLSEETEFGRKWIALCEAHLGPTGIRDHIRCYEYMGRFYVEEGNKRVSVLASYGAPTIPGHVIRLIPAYSDDPAVRAYYEFMDFYRLTGLYQVSFRTPGNYSKLKALLGYEADYVWSTDERASFTSALWRFSRMLEKYNLKDMHISEADALLVWLRVHTMQDIKDMYSSDLEEAVAAIMSDVRLLAHGLHIDVSTEPEAPEQSIISWLTGSGRPSHLNIAFIYSASPEVSDWARVHDLGRQYLEQKLGGKITVQSYVIAGDAEDETMEQAVADGAQVIFAVSPPLVGACCRLAVKHPNVRILNCSLSMPLAGVRSYYCRNYEGKFITGAISAAMSREDKIGYVANYPIFGIPAAINAFALGAQLVRPGIRVELKWSCLPGDPIEEFTRDGVRVIANRDTSTQEFRPWKYSWGTYITHDDGTVLPLTSASWNWGKLYQKIVENIFAGGWPLDEKDKAVNYWWGISTGVIAVQTNPQLPEGIIRLCDILRNGIAEGSVDPFLCTIRDQSGNIRNDGSRIFTPEEIINMDWLCDLVDGHIPKYEELLPVSRKMTRLLGVYRDEIPPEREEFLI